MNELYNNLLARANALTKNHKENSEDLVQEAFLKFYENYPDFSGSDEEQHKLLNTILTNTHIDSHRKLKETVFSDLETEDEDGQAMTFEPSGGIGDVNYSDVEILIKNLTPKLRDAANLILIKGMSYTDTAEALGITMPALHSRIYKVRKQFQQELGD